MKFFISPELTKVTILSFVTGLPEPLTDFTPCQLCYRLIASLPGVLSKMVGSNSF